MWVALVCQKIRKGNAQVTKGNILIVISDAVSSIPQFQQNWVNFRLQKKLTFVHSL